MAKYVLSEAADADLTEITEYTAQTFGLDQARKYPAQIVDGCEMAAAFPAIGQPYSTSAGQIFQKYNVGRHALFYQTTEHGVFVVRILHLMMDFDVHLD